MKFAVTINLAGIDDAGLSDKTDLADWVILEYIADWYTVPKAARRADKVCVNYRQLIEQIPILGLNSEQAVSKRILKLEKLGLLETDHEADGRVFARPSATCHAVMNDGGVCFEGDAPVQACTYCGATGVPLEMDHIIPKSRGGGDSPENLTPACRACNQSKGAMSLAEWMASK